MAQATGAGREWLVDLEHGEPTAEVGQVLRTFEALGIEFDILMLRVPPAWTVPMTAAAEERRAPLAATCPPGRPSKPRRTSPRRTIILRSISGTPGATPR